MRRWRVRGHVPGAALLHDHDQPEDPRRRSRAERGNPWLVHHPTLENFIELISQCRLPRLLPEFGDGDRLRGGDLHGDLGAGRIRPGANGVQGQPTLATGVFLTYLIPNSLLFIPLFQIIGALGLINNVWCLVVIYPTLAVPFCTWIMIGYFSSIPKELDEVALIDGAGYLQMLWTHLHSGGDARDHRRDHLRFHGELGRVPVSDGLSVHREPDGADRRHRQRPDPRRRVPVGQDHGRLRIWPPRRPSSSMRS